MKSEIDYASGIFGGIKNTWGGILLLGLLFVCYSFFCMALIVGCKLLEFEMLFFAAPFIVLFWPLFNIVGAGCPGVLVTGGIVCVSNFFVREPESRGKWGGVLCILISLQGFLMSLGEMTFSFAAIYLVITLSPPGIFWFISDRLRKRRIKALERQADEMERQYLLGQRKVEPEEYLRR